MRFGINFFLCIVIVLLSACAGNVVNPFADLREVKPATLIEGPLTETGSDNTYTQAQIDHGRYLVGLLGCSSCHTDGALVGTPVAERYLAGSNTGIAYSNPMREPNPGVVYPPNLTPDTRTGIGRWNDEALIQLVRVGINPDGGHALPVMPWPAYSRLSDEDILTIIAYLRSLPPVNHQVPENVTPGNRARAPFVYFGVYQSIQ